MRNADVEIARSILTCSEATARHYLSIFDNNLERAVQVVLTYGHDRDWWGHPPINNRRGEGNEREETEIMSNTHTKDRIDHLNQQHDGKTVGTNLGDVSSSPSDSGPTMEDVWNDRVSREFYILYSHLIDRFVEAICHNEPKDALRILVSEADKTIALDSGVALQESDLINRLSYKHKTRDGRSPLSYAVAMNLKQQVYDLLELGANITKCMPSLLEEGRHHTALTIAATNSKRDGTEMVRILLSKGARPTELVSANVDEKELGRGMRYWINKSRRLTVPSPEDLEHASKTPPMDRIHEMDYAVMGQESAVSIIQGEL